MVEELQPCSITLDCNLFEASITKVITTRVASLHHHVAPSLLKMSASQPSQTLYISNIAYDKARKDGASRPPPHPARRPHLAMNLPDPFACPVLLAAVLTEVRRALYALFSTYGRVVDVVHTRAPRMRGTAFVVFRDLASSTAAMRGLDGESFYGRGLVSPRSSVFRLVSGSRGVR